MPDFIFSSEKMKAIMAVSEGNGREAIKRRLPKAELDHVKPEKTGARAADHIKASGLKARGFKIPDG